MAAGLPVVAPTVEVVGGTRGRVRSRRPRLATLLIAGLLVAGAATSLAGTAPAAAQVTTTLTAAEVRELIATAPRVDLFDVTIVGDLDLTSIGTVKVPLRCTRCRIEGSVLAPDVTFARQVDLDEVTVTGRVDLRGAVFAGPLLARSEGDLGEVRGLADFSFATFGDGAAFDGIHFGYVANFTGTRFASGASFIGATFESDARFDQATFGGFTSFSGLRRGPAGDQRGTFKGPATFRNARFAAVVDMTGGHYLDVLDLRGATFGEGLGLLGTTVGKGLLARGVAFSTLDARTLRAEAGDIDFKEAKGRALQLSGASVDTGSIVLTYAAVTDSVSLERIRMRGTCPKPANAEPGIPVPPGCILLEQLVTAQLQMDLSLVPRVFGEAPQRNTLRAIEATERKDGNSDKANSAEYLLLRSEGQRKSGLAYLFDLVFYRGAAGYLVRPLHPLVTLLLVILVGWIVRLIYRDNRTGHMATDLKGARRATVRLGARVAKWLEALTAALAAAFRPKPNITVAEEDRETPIAYVIAGLLLLEYVASKALILVFFLCLANYNQTLRELIQGVLP